MLFFGKSKAATDPNQPKKRSTFGLLFNPEIGKAIQPLGETTSVFVQLIAMVFAMNGLFPKDHPGIQGVPGARLKLSEIFSVAWNGLSFTRQGLPKVVLFFAVSGTIVFAILSVITALLAGMMGTAHAATTSTSGFFSPAGDHDLAQNWLDYIFKGAPLVDYYAQNGQPIAQTTGIQCSMITALGFYSQAMLIFAAVILFYHLVSMVVNTAHEGVAMGKKANQIWAPIRLVVAVGLLVPMGSGGSSCSYGSNTSTAGLNAGQFIVIKMSEWGSGLASQTWGVFVRSLSDRGNDYIMPNVPMITGMIKDVAMMESCKWLWNYNVCSTSNPEQTPDQWAQCAAMEPQAGQPHAEEKITRKSYSQAGVLHIQYTPLNTIRNRNVCGSVTIPVATKINYAKANPLIDVAQSGFDSTTIANSIQEAHKNTFINMAERFAALGAQVRTLIPELNPDQIKDNTDYAALVNDYQTTLKQNLDRALKGAKGNLSAGDADKIAALGWAGAGAWLNTIARDQGAIVNAYENGLPSTQRPDFTGLENNTTAQNVLTRLKNFSAWVDYQPAGTGENILCDSQLTAAKGSGSATGTDTSVPGTGMGSAAMDDLKKDIANGVVNMGEAERSMKALIERLSGKGLGENEKITDAIFRVINAQAKRSGVWSDTTNACPGQKGAFTLGAQLVTSNPLQEFSFWGHANLRAAYSMWDDIMYLSVASVVKQQEKEVTEFTQGRNTDERTHIVELGLMSQYYSFVAGIFSLFAIIFMSAGYTVAFVTPLFPFFRFFFNVLTWIVSTLEAIVAIPLVALAHLNPEGEGLPGQSAKAAYFMIFNIFVRPVLTVFGLIAGLLVFYVAIMLLNMTFAIAVAGTSASAHTGYETLVRVAFTVTYAAAVYTCANNAFKTIGFFPEHALRWIGAQAHHERMGDGGRTIQAAMGQAQGILGEKAISTIRLKS